ncbi:ABATE domain-containing protein [Streptomyces sp. MUM 203J]|uniref:BTAD domain-containing putative transcriptional regulator n=1 Tax=Streptomyces sp. MUM 203J TaxID=2791990 RepID=UPI001F04EBD4|nr:BTAD domain-containing putative transcriptional regulator [Streptomyces sp. MUM 203J]MCH0543335.1 ABATE domain-containing protein [Streptomyces sp. MUM 203J]
MEFLLLGPFEAHNDDDRPMLDGSRRQERCLLGILLLNRDRVVSTARIVDLLWDGTASPESARGTVHTYVGRLRSRLGPAGPRIETRHDGYALADGPYRVDAERFAALVRDAGAAGDPAERVALYDRAVALWRGPLLADVADDRLRDRVGGELAALRTTVLEQRAEAQLAMGLHDRVAAELAGPAQEFPDRERLVAALMTALYRCGRRAEALELYRRTRQALADGLGVEPGTGLSRLHLRILRRDPRLDRPAAPLYAVRVGDEWLPWSTGGHPALEFCNTYAGWPGARGPGSDWLRGYSTLAVWAGHVDLAEEAAVARLLARARRDPDGAAAVLQEARDFRTSLYRCLTDVSDEEAFGRVADVARQAATASEFARAEDGLGHWRVAPSAGLRLPLWAVARSAAELLADPRRFTVRACPSDDCGWLFLDPAARRRWCSLATCGARAGE